MVHGDIKPQNVLVFKDATGKTTIKVADFGYSTLAAGETRKVLLPKSTPWNAPEHHFGEFSVPEAKKTDVYSFGMLCLWVLFASMPRPPNVTQFTFDISTGPHTSLEDFKGNNKLEEIASQLIESVPLARMNAGRRLSLNEFFSLTVPLNPEKRTSDLGKLIVLLCPER